jgi:hypothetical protein
MAKRHVAAAFPVIILVLASAFVTPAYAAGDSSELMTAVKNVSAQADKFRSMMSNLNASQFHVVNVASVMNPGDQSSYQSSLKKNASEISDLRDTLTHTTVTGDDGVVVPLRKVLVTKNVTIDQVIGVFVANDGQITLFYR